MNYLIYISSAVQLMNENELTDLLTVSRKNNDHNNITGMLLYGEGSFIQVLEGKKDNIQSTFDIIKKDPRHKNVTLILEGSIEQRNFADWKMGFMSVNKEQLDELEGYIDPSGKHFLNEGSAEPAILVLKTFTETNKRYFKA